jgi:hypothetical protein
VLCLQHILSLGLASKLACCACCLCWFCSGQGSKDVDLPVASKECQPTVAMWAMIHIPTGSPHTRDASDTSIKKYASQIYNIKHSCKCTPYGHPVCGNVMHACMHACMHGFMCPSMCSAFHQNDLQAGSKQKLPSFHSHPSRCVLWRSPEHRLRS